MIGDIAVVVFDKTGTITRGEPAVQAVVPAEGFTDRDVLAAAASVEINSEHPLARAVQDAATDVKLAAADDFESHTGRGVEATIEGARVVVGKPDWLTAADVNLAPPDDDRQRLEDKGQTVIAVARDARLLGLIRIADTIKDDARDTIQRIIEVGITPVMITGDNRRNARTVANEVGIDEVLAEVLPSEKAVNIRQLQEGGRRVMMVGDGINDAPALTQADIGVAVGAGTDIAIESAGIVIMSDRLGAVIDAHQIGKSSYRKTKQNLTLAFSFNGIGVTAAVTGLISPVWAMIAMISSVTAMLANSFGGQLLRGESPKTGYQTLAHDDHHQAPDEPTTNQNREPNKFSQTAILDTWIDGHTVRF